MGWNCPRCGHLLTPKEEHMVVDAKSGNFAVDHNVCEDCEAEYITIFNSGGYGYYIQIVQLPITEIRHIDSEKQLLDSIRTIFEKCPECGIQAKGYGYDSKQKIVMLTCGNHNWKPQTPIPIFVFDIPHPSDPNYYCSGCGRNAWGSHICVRISV